uniref:Interleukin-4 n=1 Tax=Scophthalmus maximus TaxID=52904 RepID=A0A8D2ZVS8_SCOMX
MKNFRIQSFSLMMMIMMVNAARLPLHDNTTKKGLPANNITKEDLLAQIHEETSCWIMLLTVPFSTQKEFFCLAEKSLHGIQNITKLTRHLHQYNKKTETVICHLEKNQRTSLKILLNDIEKCSRINKSK